MITILGNISLWLCLCFTIFQFVNSLKKNELIKYSDLIIFSDGAKKENEKYDVDRVRNFIKNIKGFNSVKIYFRNKNYGLSKIKLVDATLLAKDLLGDEIFKGKISRDVYLAPGRVDNVEGSYDDLMMNKCGRIRSVEFPDIKYVLDVLKIAFEDNTVLEFN